MSAVEKAPAPVWRQVAFISAVAIALYAGFRALPTGTNLNHMDFRVTGANSLEFCDPTNPQFLPVVNVRSPVSMNVQAEQAPMALQEVRASIVLKTSGGKPIEPADLLVAHTKKLHLMIVDPTLRDYHHVHPEPVEKGAPGEWSFAFTPRSNGTYRMFADFTPAATARGLYANADIEIGGPADTRMMAAPKRAFEPVELDGYRFELETAKPLRAGQPADIHFTITRNGGGVVPLEPVMGAFAHLVAFDETRSGFAHLHPNEVDLSKPPDAQRPRLSFKITIPTAGRYVIWAQVNLAGKERFVPFWFDVAER